MAAGSSSGPGDAAATTATPEPDPSGCPPYMPGCPCLFDACDEGLSCVDGVCEPSPVDDTTTGATDTATETDNETDPAVQDTGSTSEPVAPETSSTSDGDSSSSGEDPTTGGPGEDPCASAGSGSGHYCGMSIGGESNVLYQCNAQGETVAQHVGAGCPVCVVCPAGFADYCEGGYVPAQSCI